MVVLAIEATGLVKRYKEVMALDGVDLAVPEGSVLATARAERRRQDHRRADPDHLDAAGRAGPGWPAIDVLRTRARCGA